MATLTDVQLVRLMANDPEAPDACFSDDEIKGFLTLEGGVVKMAAAQAIDTIADNEALVSKVMTSQGGLETDGAKVADALRKRAAALRAQVVTDNTNAADGSYVEFISPGPACPPELTEHHVPCWWP